MSSDNFEPLPNEIRWLDRATWTRRRRKETRIQLRRLRDSIARLDAARTEPRSAGDVHLVVIPHDGPDTGLWHPANGNHFFEVHASAVELLGSDRVTLVDIVCGEDATTWQAAVLDRIAETRATHVIAQIERDPNKTTDWSWDVIASALAGHWDGVFVGQMYDAGFQWLRVRAQRLAGILDKLVLADLCEPMTGYAVPGRPEIGPMTLPLSRESVSRIDAYVAGATKVHDVTFVGALYEYRVELLDRLTAAGFHVAVNPHRSDSARTDEESRANQPSYLDYMRALAESELTINFARASSGPRWQYKIRPQEAALVGCLCLTDDVDRTSRFFAPGDYAYFESVDTLSDIVGELLVDRTALQSAQARARARAHELAVVDYWGRIDDGLRRRGLPVITGLTAPDPPHAG